MSATLIGMSNATAFIERSYHQCLPKQWYREVLKNAIESKATKVEFGVEWQAVEKNGVYRRKISDNGEGMTAQELNDYFKTIGSSGKSSGFDPNVVDSAIHGNFGIGCRISLLPWNPEGVIYVSYKNGKASMLWMFFDREQNAYALKPFKVGDEIVEVIDPTEIAWDEIPEEYSYGVDWSSVAPSWSREHGTCIILLGKDRTHDTFISSDTDSEKNETRSATKYINTRFYDLTGIEVTSLEFNFGRDKKHCWPTSEKGEAGFHSKIGGKDNTARGTIRTCHGASHFFTEDSKGSNVISGSELLDEKRVKVSWFYRERKSDSELKKLFPNKNLEDILDIPQNDGYSPGSSFIGIKYKDELFKITDSVANFRNFGICHKNLRDRIVIIIEPQLYSKDREWGVFPDSQRNRLCFTGNGERSIDPPIRDWGDSFVKSIPKEIRKALADLHGSDNLGIKDEEIFKKIRERMGSRWNDTIVLSNPKKGKMAIVLESEVCIGVDKSSVTVDASNDGSETHISQKTAHGHGDGSGGGNGGSGKGGSGNGGSGGHGGSGGKRSPLTTISNGNFVSDGSPVSLVKKAELSKEGDTKAIEIKVKQDIPKCHILTKEEFEEDNQKWVILSYSSNYGGKAEPALLLNRDSALVQENIRNYQQKYNDNYKDEVERVVLESLQIICSARLAHALKLRKVLAKNRLEDDFFSDASLTYSCYGLIADDMFISSRLGHIKKI